MKAIDRWLARHLFHPIIIVICHATRQTQYAISRALWFFAACHTAFYSKSDNWLWLIFIWSFVVIQFLDASIRPDRHYRSSGFLRASFAIFFIDGLAAAIFISGDWHHPIRNLLILFAEYAATIKTLPPRQTKAKRFTKKATSNG